MTARQRADRLLVERGLFDSRAKAQAAIAAGLVSANNVTVRKASESDRRECGLARAPGASLRLARRGQARGGARSFRFRSARPRLPRRRRLHRRLHASAAGARRQACLCDGRGARAIARIAAPTPRGRFAGGNRHPYVLPAPPGYEAGFDRRRRQFHLAEIGAAARARAGETAGAIGRADQAAIRGRPRGAQERHRARSRPCTPRSATTSRPSSPRSAGAFSASSPRPSTAATAMPNFCSEPPSDRATHHCPPRPSRRRRGRYAGRPRLRALRAAGRNGDGRAGRRPSRPPPSRPCRQTEPRAGRADLQTFHPMRRLRHAALVARRISFVEARPGRRGAGASQYRRAARSADRRARTGPPPRGAACAAWHAGRFRSRLHRAARAPHRRHRHLPDFGAGPCWRDSCGLGDRRNPQARRPSRSTSR